MPILGEIKRGRDLGYGTDNKLVWCACVDCGKARWVFLKWGKPVSPRCNRCAQWKGGRIVDSNGYIKVLLYPDDFFYSMTGAMGYVMEHRLIVARALGRNLHRWEIVHHKNHIRHDNRIENLQLVSDDRHRQITILENRISYLEKRVTLLEAENTLLERRAVRGGEPIASNEQWAGDKDTIFIA